MRRDPKPYLQAAYDSIVDDLLKEAIMSGNVSAPMRQLARIPGAKNKLTGRRSAFVGLYWADKTFLLPGLYVWLVNRHWRVLPLPKRRYP